MIFMKRIINLVNDKIELNKKLGQAHVLLEESRTFSNKVLRANQDINLNYEVVKNQLHDLEMLLEAAVDNGGSLKYKGMLFRFVGFRDAGGKFVKRKDVVKNTEGHYVGKGKDNGND